MRSMGRIQFVHTHNDIISLDNLLSAWQEFVKGKRSRKDVQEFERNLMGNIISLHKNLATQTYTHSAYEAFNISDPKPRNIHKAKVRDRLLHHALYRKLYQFFDRTFIADSYSCRYGKGVHRAMNRFRTFVYTVSKNDTHTCWVLKCDIRKFFASIDHCVLKQILAKYIPDKSILWLLGRVIDSFHTKDKHDIGLPLGDLTSQLLVNIYMNKFDQFMKHKLKAKYYVRYADDFVILSQNRQRLENILPKMKDFLQSELKLELHPDKVSIQTCSSGVDFLGWVHFPNHRVLRTVTRKRMARALRVGVSEGALHSYRGLLLNGNAYKISQEISENITPRHADAL